VVCHHLDRLHERQLRRLAALAAIGAATDDLTGLAIELAAAIGEALFIALFPAAGPVLIFVPQVFISFGNGMLLPNAIAGAVSVEPHAAGTASGITGFTQMALGAALAQLITVALVGATTPMPIALMILGVVVISGVSFLALVRR
jgi:DHA1 family bicyclomycin/chloramphenicol resistance-like MFS transporter